MAEETLQELAAEHGKEVATQRYGQEINAETFAICKADLLLKGEGEAADKLSKMKQSTALGSRIAEVRIYVDTSVIGGCEDEEFREPFRRLIQRFTQGEMTLVLSPLVVEELRGSPRRVREVLLGVPAAHIETLKVTAEADALAAKYIERGALT